MSLVFMWIILYGSISPLLISSLRANTNEMSKYFETKRFFILNVVNNTYWYPYLIFGAILFLIYTWTFLVNRNLYAHYKGRYSVNVLPEYYRMLWFEPVKSHSANNNLRNIIFNTSFIIPVLCRYLITYYDCLKW